MSHELGKLPARAGAFSFQWGQFFDTTKLPTPPTRFGHSLGIEWGVLANNDIGNCVVAGACHETMLYTDEWGEPARFDDALATKIYSDIGGYVPGEPDTDQGLDMQVAASYRRRTGIVDLDGRVHRVHAYVGMSPTDINSLMSAIYLFGAVGLGLRFPASAMRQFDREEVWSPVAFSTIIGGHYVSLVGRNSRGNLLCVTWGRLHAMTPSFLSKYADEAVAYISLETLSAKGATPEGFNHAALDAALAALPRG